MAIERWAPERHLGVIGSWLRARGQADDAGDARLYPSTGLVVDQCAAGFLFTTNAPLVGYLDGLVTDPAAPVRRRHAATKLLCLRLADEAAELGVELLLMSSNIRGVLQVCKRVGFSTYGTGFEYLAMRVGGR